MNSNKKELFVVVGAILSMAVLLTAIIKPEEDVQEAPGETREAALWNYDVPPENEPVLCSWPRQGASGRDYYEVVRAGDAYYALMDSGAMTVCIERSRPIAWAKLPEGVK